MGRASRERIKKIKFPRYSEEIVKRFLAITDLTSVVSDMMDSMGICGVVPGSHIGPVIPHRRIAGTVVTLRNVPERKATAKGYADKDTFRMSAREIYFLSEPGDVLVADFGGNCETSNLGGNSCIIGKMRGFAGAIVERRGPRRRGDRIHAIDYPVWSKGVTPMSGKYRLETIEINAPVTVHDIVVYPGDLALADPSGVAFVPREHVETILAKIEAEEVNVRKIREMLIEKVSIDELRDIWLPPAARRG